MSLRERVSVPSGFAKLLQGDSRPNPLTVNQQIQEVAAIRQSLYELESQHAKIRSE
jgi:hypothetical protein